MTKKVRLWLALFLLVLDNRADPYRGKSFIRLNCVRRQAISVRAPSAPKVVGIKVFGPFAPRSFNFGTTHGRFDRTDNTCGYLVLKIKNVGKLAITLFSPKMIGGSRLDKLRRYS